MAWEQKTHSAGTVQNEVAHGSWMQKRSYDICCVANGETCSQTEEEHHFYHCHARNDVLQSNSCHVVRLVVEEASVVAQEILKSKRKGSTWLLMAALLRGTYDTKQKRW